MSDFHGQPSKRSSVGKHLSPKTHALLKAIKSNRRLKITVLTDDYEVESFSFSQAREVACREIIQPEPLQKP